MGTNPCLVISDLETQNLGLRSSGEYKHKEQYVTASLRGLYTPIYRFSKQY